MKIAKGKIWEITSRGFTGTIKVLEDIDTEKDVFFEAEIVEGIKSYLSLNRYQETKGDKLRFRITLTDFIKEDDKLEKIVREKLKQIRK